MGPFLKSFFCGKGGDEWQSDNPLGFRFRYAIHPFRLLRGSLQGRAQVSPHLELHILNGREHDIVLGNDEDLTLNFLSKHTRCTFP